MCDWQYVLNSTLYCAEEKVSDIDGGVKESLNGDSTELIGEEREKRGGGIRGLGECEEIDMEKEEKITNVIWPAAAVIISHSSYVWKICNNIQKQQQHVAFKHHVTTVWGILLRQPSHSFPTRVKANWATWPKAWHLWFSIEKEKQHIETLMTVVSRWTQTQMIVSANVRGCLRISSAMRFVQFSNRLTGLLCDGRVTCTYNHSHTIVLYTLHQKSIGNWWELIWLDNCKHISTATVRLLSM